MKKLSFVLMCFLTTVIFAQNKTYYNFAVNNCVEENTEGLIDKCIKGSYLLNYNFTTMDSKTVSTDKINKPIVLIANATWSAPCWGDVPALNKMVEKYNDQLEFVMIFWDKEAKVKRMAEKLDKRIKLVPARDIDKVQKGYLDISGFVHKLDYPTAYLISKDKQFVNIKRGAATPTKEVSWDKVNEINTKNFEDFLAPILK
ncbi:thiol-disulfide isomerase/thioredoxin [Tenacibaculum gallaicum]|uniref:Thiol-disulfide isomerase/thioredoxin n=1 Tax=Tenacibaculum gallaicum TaxID=561505 RepID=A0A3E0HXE3_9FLAO|nr:MULTISPECIES: thioredoxin family protein [Tenacibaculum]MDO6674671.1 thioredoxin family protein [Tenacibaculum sp. 1_MG-2023]MDX8553325.1 thioredoxin family protein [Tenacibaculum sp. 1B UA]REH50625.1 thiol-disulfide isomerase/thioredoxin [Tenacibaculum gallaicum]